MSSNDGVLSPISSTSSQHVEASDNSIEYYVKASKEESEYVGASGNKRKEVCCTCKFFVPAQEACTVVVGRIEEKAYCKLYIEGGEKMTEKGLNVDESVTTDNAYVANHQTTEPDPESELAMQKAASAPTYTKPAEQAGVNAYGTTANTTLDAPSAGETTEPSSVKKAACCSDCGEECNGNCCENCMKVAKATCCSDCGGSGCDGNCCEKCMGMSKAAGCSCTCDQCQKCAGMGMSKSESSADEKKEPAPDVEELEGKEIKKSLWGNAFLPRI